MNRNTILGLLVLLAFSNAAFASLSCSLSIHSWNNGYVANLTVTNEGDSSLEGWEVFLEYSKAPEINSNWGAELEVQSGYVVAKNVSWNGMLKSGESAYFGYVGAHSGDFTAPECVIEMLQDEPLAKYLKDGVKNHLEYRGVQYGSSSSSSTGGLSSSNSSASSSASSASSSSGAASADGDITNTQELGVDEADIIESDGTHLYVVRGFSRASSHPVYGTTSSSTSSASSSTSASSTTSTSSTSSSSSSSSTTSGGGSNSSMALLSITAYQKDSVNGSASKVADISLPYDQNTVTLAGAYYFPSENGKHLISVGETLNSTFFGWNYYHGYYAYYQTSNKVSLVTTNVSDPSAMVEVERMQFDGSLVSSRRIGNTLFIASRYSPSLKRLGLSLNSSSGTENLARVEEASLDDLLPHIYDEEGGSKPLLSKDDCIVPEWPEKVDAYAGSLLVLTKINLDDSSDIESRCLPASATDIFASQDAVYAFGYGYNREMKIHKFAIDEAFEYRGSIKVAGSIPCSERPYCFGEKDGVLRVLYSANSAFIEGGLTTDTRYRIALIGESSTGTELELVSTLPNASRPESIGKPGERIYGMRSFGEHAYVVTFDKVDPLYAIDLSDPEDPYIAGALEVEGFSQYLHPVGENLLIGVGKDAYYDAIRDITWYQGVKVELFDISDPTMLRSLGSEIIGKRGSNTTVNYDPRAFAFRDDEYGMRFSLPIQVNTLLPNNGNPDLPNQFYNHEHTGLYVFEIEDGAGGDAVLSRKGVLKVPSPGSIFNDRGVLDEGAVFYLHNYRMLAGLLSELEME
ncbi:Cellulose binding domain-containing protein [Alteromonadaceae bacterium Bs31]|nr:Cellulose binding domain-containing protein [Alteromonadaceae bacterium Bs31]